MTASFDGRAVTYGFGELDTLVPAYAATSQKPRLGISRSRHPGLDPALRHAPAEPALHRCHARQEAGRAGGPEEGCRHRRAQRVWAAPMVKAERMVGRSCRGAK